jgi:predicted nucleic acid-binding protein
MPAAAVMKANHISQIATFNTADFKRYAGIDPVHPDKIS